MPSFQSSIAGALLLSTCLFAGCHTQANSHEADAQQGLRCNLDNQSIAFHGSRLDIPDDQVLTSVGPLVSSLATQSSSQPLLIQAAPETTANTLLRVLLSAQEARLDEAYLSVSDRWLELALPDSSTIPPMSVADIFFSLSSGTITASRDLAALGNPSPGATPIENQRVEIERLVKSNCSREAPCTHVVLSIGSAVSFKEMSDLMTVLSEFREGAGSLRLVINGDPPPGAREVLTQRCAAHAGDDSRNRRGLKRSVSDVSGKVVREYRSGWHDHNQVYRDWAWTRVRR